MRWALVWPLLLGGACATTGGPGDASTYAEAHERWTRRKAVLHEVDTALQVGATYKAWEFRSAYAERHATVFRLPETRRQELLETERAEHHAGHEFYVAAASHKDEWNDLDQPQSTWRVVLVCDDRQEVEPSLIHRHRKVTTQMQEFFPQTDSFSLAYRIVFPRKRPNGSETCGPDAGRVTLRFTGPLGMLELTWDLR